MNNCLSGTMSLGANLLSIFVPSYFLTVTKQRETYFVIEQFLREPVSEDELLRLGYSQVNGNSIPDYIKHAIQVEKLWMSVRDAFNAIKNWHLNFELYHLLGLVTTQHLLKI